MTTILMPGLIGHAPHAPAPVTSLPTPVVEYQLDQASGTTATDSQGLVNLTFTGTVEHAVQSIVVGDETTATGFNGTDTHATGTHNAALEFATGFSIVAYLQVDRVPTSNVVFFSKDGSPSPDGGASLEIVNTSGQSWLRAYGAPGGLPEWIISNNGIIQLTPDVATLVVFTFHPVNGCKAYVDKALVATVPGLLIDWVNNAADLSVGAHNSGAGFLNGVLKALTIYGEVLSQEQVDLLDDARSAGSLDNFNAGSLVDETSGTLPLTAGAPRPATGFTVAISPDLANGGTVTDNGEAADYDLTGSALGADSFGAALTAGGRATPVATVSLTVAAAAAASAIPISLAEVATAAGSAVTAEVDVAGSGDHTTLQAALNAASPGDVIAVKGASGAYQYPETWTLSGVNGTGGSPIQIWGWSADGNQPEITAEHTGAVTWTLDNAAKLVYRATVSGANYAYGFLPENEGSWQLIMHQSEANFLRAETDNLYLGPSMWASGGTVYVRTQAGRRQTERLVPDSILNATLPVDTNPNNWTGFRFSTKTGHSWNFSSCSHIQFNWLHWFGGQHAIDVEASSSDIDFRFGKVWFSREGINLAGDDCWIDNIEFQERVPPWLADDDVKGVNRILNQFLNSTIKFDGSTGHEVSNTTAWYSMNWCLAGSDAGNLHVHHNLAIGVRDDTAQMGSSSINWEMNHNIFLGFLGPAHSTGSGHPSGQEAQVYLHHNIFDMGHACLANGLGLIHDNAAPFAYKADKIRGSHSTPNAPIPWRYWNNTAIIADPSDVSKGLASNLGYLYGDSAARNASGEDRGHECWNTIIICTGDGALLGVSGFGDVVTHHPSVSNNTPSEMMDGMMFKKSGSSVPALKSLTRLPGPVRANFTTLAVYKAQNGGTHYSASEDTEKYPQSPWRWNGNSIEEDPLLGGAVHTALTAFTLDAQGRFQIPANWSMYVPVNTKCEDQGVNIAGRWSALSPPIGPNDDSGIESARTQFYIGAIDPVEDSTGASIGPQT